MEMGSRLMLSCVEFLWRSALFGGRRTHALTLSVWPPESRRRQEPVQREDRKLLKPPACMQCLYRRRYLFFSIPAYFVFHLLLKTPKTLF